MCPSMNMNKNDLDESELSKEWILNLFYSTKGNLNDINRAIDEKLKLRGLRNITVFEEFIKNRLNPCGRLYGEIFWNLIKQVFFKIFTDTKKDEGTYNHIVDPSNRSIIKFVRFKFDSGDTILIQCYDFEENFRIKNNWTEDLDISITPLEIYKWFRP